MPTGPEKGENRVKEEYKNVCQIIDNWLEEKDKGEDQIRVFTRLSTISEKVQNMIIAAYLGSGWKDAMFENDQREGYYFILCR